MAAPSSASGSSHSHRDWRFSQCFGETAAQAEQSDADILSAVEFDQTGRYLATGDRGGRIVIFETDKASATSSSDDPKRIEGKKRKGTTEYRFHCEFQSHEPEFDYLKSLEIEEKINQIKWCPPCGGSMFLLSTNGKWFSPSSNHVPID
jgi:serine/threonine-protein phosphatase 2A regulatory subunit B